jgi:hypothetical protein
MGATWSDEQVRQIIALVRTDGFVTVVSDGNAAGIRWGLGLVPELAIHRRVSWVKLGEGKRPTDYPPEGIRGLLPRPTPPIKAPTGEKSGAATRHRLLIKEVGTREAIVELANLFPTLRAFKLDAKSWDANQLDSMSGKLSSAELFSVQFILRVWNQYQKWQCGNFDIVQAMDSWDSAHREAFLSWASDPWWA